MEFQCIALIGFIQLREQLSFLKTQFMSYHSYMLAESTFTSQRLGVAAVRSIPIVILFHNITCNFCLLDQVLPKKARGCHTCQYKNDLLDILCK